MKISCEELLRQRDLVARHLEWIEEQLRIEDSSQAEIESQVEPTPRELLSPRSAETPTPQPPPCLQNRPQRKQNRS